tara:strand:- start:795 stop:1583 length:789 start_codon:yes stop_codon:yes gene_type:complete
MAKNFKHLAVVKGNVDVSNNLAYAADDLIFDWTRIEVPRGAFSIHSWNIILQGADTTAGANAHDMGFYIAREVDGVAPPSLGTSNTGATKITANAARPHIIGHIYVDFSASEDLHDPLKSYNVLSSSGNGSLVTNNNNLPSFNGSMVIEGDSKTTAPAGSQYIYVACFAGSGTQNFGTGVLAAGAHTSGLSIDVDGNDADDTFAVGDEIVALASDGSDAQVVGTITALTDATITVDALGGALADDDEICHRHPIVLYLGLDY